MNFSEFIEQVKETPALLKFVANDKTWASDMKHIGMMNAGVRLARKNSAKRVIERYQAAKEGGTL